MDYFPCPQKIDNMSKERSIRKELLEMWHLVLIQLVKSSKALELSEKDLAREIIQLEDRVDSSEFLIDMECRKYIAQLDQQPIDLIFAMSVIKINMHLQRIGDITENIAYHVLNSKSIFKTEILKHTQIITQFKESIEMLQCTFDSFEQAEPGLCNELVTKFADSKSKDVNKLIISYLDQNPSDIDLSLHMFTIIRNLERINEQIRCIADEILSVAGNISKKELLIG